MTFIDIFAGLGGFHLALAHLGHECVWACESAKKLRRLYAVNFPGTPIAGDITKVAVEDIPAHDILCAGFPCQPFSLAGKKEGFDDEKGRGNLFLQVCRVAAFHRPTYLLLENVKQLFHHDGGRTWTIMQEHLQQLGYGVSMAILSPHQFGIPQHRERVYIVCQYGKTAAEMAQFPFPEPTNAPTDIGDFLHPDATLLRPVLPDKWRTLALWDEFLHRLYEREGVIPNHPIWAMELGADYDYWDVQPCELEAAQLRGRRGAFGRPIVGRTREVCRRQLPLYAQKKLTVEQRRIIRSNRALYERNRDWMDPWAARMAQQLPNHQRMEWRLGEVAASDIGIYQHIVQFRSSGVRIRHRKYVPTLTCVTSETPFIPWVPVRPELRLPGEPPCGRYLTLDECARLQGMQELRWDIDGKPALPLVRCYKALGNAINVDVMERVARGLMTPQ